jgi:hypothetical protein
MIVLLVVLLLDGDSFPGFEEEKATEKGSNATAITKVTW